MRNNTRNVFLILDQYLTEFSLRLKSLSEHRGLKTVLLTSADTVRDVALVFHLSEKDLNFNLRYHDVDIKTQDIAGVYCGISTFEPTLWERFSSKDAEYAARETQALWLAILASLPCHVINPPSLDSLAGTLLSTPEILYLAHRLGFRVPMVISLESGKIAAEVLGSGVRARYADLGEVWGNETCLRPDDLPVLEKNDDHFRVLEEVPGKPTYVTLLGDKFFACEADSGASIVCLSSRRIPRPIKVRLRTLHKRLKLVLAEYSFRVMADDNWTFLGCTRPPIYAVAAHSDALLGQVVDYAVGKKGVTW
ncbi:MAG: hypothetical protein AB1442_08825 [Nitrospirota bacterium]